MPYIKQEERARCDLVVKQMADSGIKANGDLNYILFKYCKEYIQPSYNNYKNCIGELQETVAEIRRRLLAPYEDQKIRENGDV